MSRYNDTGHVTETPDGDIPLYSRVKKTATGVDLAAAADPTYGSALRAGYAEVPERGQEEISVKIFSAAGTHFAIAADQIEAGDQIQGADDGKIALLDAGPAIGLCVESTGAFDAATESPVIEVVYYSPTGQVTAPAVAAEPAAT